MPAAAAATATKNFAVNTLKPETETFLNNIKEPLQKIPKENFELVKTELSSKNKNLPQKFHIYLDEVIEHYLK